jgi:hypothetical protein
MKKMKLFAAMFCAMATLAFTSCSSDIEEDIIGTWKATKMTATTTISGFTGEYAELNGTQTEDMSPEEGESYTITFNEDGTYAAVTVDEEGTETENGKYTIKDDKLIMGEMKCDVDIDGDNMTLTAKEKDTYDEGGQHATMESKVVIKLKRI